MIRRFLLWLFRPPRPKPPVYATKYGEEQAREPRGWYGDPRGRD